MADIKPFLCVRPVEQFVTKVVSLPYDVYTREEATEQVKNAPFSFLNIDRPETQFSSEIAINDDRVYQKAGELLERFQTERIFIQEEKPCFYLYELTKENRVQTGIVACVSVKDYENGIIKRHENTRPEKENDRIRHIESCHAQTGPIFLVCQEDETLEREMESLKEKKPLYDFTTEDNISHRVFQIEEQNHMNWIRAYFKTVDALYIADGHHRAASAVKVAQKRSNSKGENREADYFLSVIFPANKLQILGYHRVVRDLNGLSKEQFLKKVEERFQIKKCRSQEEACPRRKNTFGMYLDSEWYQLAYFQKNTEQDEVACLDVSIIQSELLAPILGIADPKTDRRLQFVGGVRGLDELERRVDRGMAVAFALYPTSMKELLAVADRGQLMPPKSTWFEPKLRSGLFIHKIGRNVV